MKKSAWAVLEKAVEESYKENADAKKLLDIVSGVEDYFIRQGKSFPFLLYAVKENIINNWKARTEDRE